MRPGGWLLLIHMCLFFAFLLCLEKKIFLRSVRWFVVVGILVSAYAIFERFGLVSPLARLYESRTSSTIGNPIQLAGFLVFPFVLSLYLLLQNKKSWINLFSSLIILLALITTGTRGVFLGLLLGSFLAGFIWVWNKYGWKRSVLAAVCVTVLFATIFFSVKTRTDQSSSLYRYTHFDDRNVSDRLGYWKIALQSFSDHPIAGVGYENYYRSAEKYYTPDLYEGEGTFIDKPHNQLLETLTTSGIIGLGLSAIVLFVIVRLLVGLKRSHGISVSAYAVLLGGLSAIYIQNLFAFDTTVFLFAFVYFLSFLVHIESTEDKKGSSSQNSPLNQLISLLLLVAVVSVTSVNLFLPIYRFSHKVLVAKQSQTPEEMSKILQSVSLLPFVYDSSEIGKIYNKKANDLLIIQQKDLSKIDALFQSSIDYYKQATEEHPLRGEYWYQYASTLMMRATAHKVPMTNFEKQITERSFELMPGRIEPKMIEAYALYLDGYPEESVGMLEKQDSRFLQSSHYLWTLAVLYSQIGRHDEAAITGFHAIEKGVRINTASNMLWVADYFAQKNDFEKVVLVYEKATSFEPDNFTLLPNLASAYVENGQIDKAIMTAEKIIAKDPLHASEARDFIASLSLY